MRHALSRLMVIGALITAVPAVVEAQVGAPAAASPTPIAEPPKPFAELSRSALSLRDSIVSLARRQIGKRYVRGGKSPSHGFDCSGLVQYIVSALQIPVPRTAQQQSHSGQAIPTDTSRLLPGDLLTFGRGHQISHIGIYVGNGRFIHASTKAGRVIETNLLRPYATGIKRWRGARRLVLTDSLPASPSSAPLLPSVPADSAG